MQFSKRMDRFGDEIFASLNDRRLALEKAGKTIYNLSVGTPDFPIPEHIQNALINAAKEPETGNTPFGIFRSSWKVYAPITRSVFR